MSDCEPDLDDSHRGDRCPKCHGPIDDGYGLAFGGFGAYQYCLNQACDWHVKDRECPVCEAVDCKDHEQDDPERTIAWAERSWKEGT